MYDHRLYRLAIKWPPGRTEFPKVECFYHEGRPAVGTCRSCFKGLCRECAADLERGLACRLRCEQDVRDLIATLDQSIRYRALSGAYARATPKVMLAIALVSMFVGLFVAAWGLSLPRYDEIALLGVPFLILAALAIRIARRLPGPEAGPTPPRPPEG